MKRKCGDFDESFVPSWTGRCHFDSFWFCQRREFRQNDNIFVSATMISSSYAVLSPLQWSYKERSGVSNHRHRDCLLNHLFRCKSKKISKLRVTGLFQGNSPVTGEFPAQKASNAENVSIWWRHHVHLSICIAYSTTLKRKCRLPIFFITDCTRNCQSDNFCCSQWLKVRQNDDISVSVYATQRR